jgi:hypothetical protein
LPAAARQIARRSHTKKSASRQPPATVAPPATPATYKPRDESP